MVKVVNKRNWKLENSEKIADSDRINLLISSEISESNKKVL